MPMLLTLRSRAFAVLVAALTVVATTTVLARQGPPRPDAQIEAMSKLDYLAGTWKGEGWTDVGGRRATFHGSEVVQQKLDGTVLLVEGSFFSKPPGADADVPVHTTLGVISFDPRTKNYRFTTWLANGSSGDRELTVTPTGWKWEIKSPRGVMRYETTISPAKDVWSEIGERSADGKTWEKFFEMTLRKQ